MTIVYIQYLGNRYRDENAMATGNIDILSIELLNRHDYDNLSEGKVIPPGICDLQLN